MANAAASFIAERYARALFSLAKQQNSLDVLARELQQLAVLAEAPEAARIFSTPLVSRAIKAQAVDALLAKSGFNALTRAFSRRLALNDRLKLLPAIATAFGRMLAKERGEMDVTVVSARGLSPQQLSELEQALKSAYGAKPRLQQKLNPALMAGFMLKVGDMQMDYSLAGQLSRLHTTLKTATHA